MRDYPRLLTFLKPHWWVLLLAVVAMVLASLFSGLPLPTVIPLVDNIISGRGIVLPDHVHVPEFVSDLVTRINALSPISLLNRLLSIVFVMLILRQIFSFLQSYFMTDVSQRVIKDIRNRIYEKFLGLSLDYYGRNPSGKLVSRITYDAAIVRDSISEGLTDLIYQPIQIMTYLGIVIVDMILFHIPLPLILTSVVIFPLVVYPVFKIGAKLKQISLQSQEKMADINTLLYETISGIRIVKAFSMEDYEQKRFDQKSYQFYKLEMKSVKRMVAISPITELIGIVASGAVIWLGAREIVRHTLSPGAFITFLMALFFLIRPLKRLSRVYGILQQALAAASRIFEVLDTPSKVVELPGAPKLTPMKDEIIFKDVSFKYDEKLILKDINLNVKKGQVVAIVGPSGVGKSTLVNLIPRFYDPTSGSVKIDGKDTRRVNLRSLRDQIGIVTQELILFNDTVAANIAYGRERRDRRKIRKAAQIANAEDFILKLPNGYDTIIGERGFRLSGGEKQRLAIARAVFKNPPIMILDEATSQLDTESEILVQTAIDRLMQNRTVFVIAHRLSTIRRATLILVLHNGRIAEQGPHDELISTDGLYKRLYEMQFRR